MCTRRGRTKVVTTSYTKKLGSMAFMLQKSTGIYMYASKSSESHSIYATKGCWLFEDLACFFSASVTVSSGRGSRAEPPPDTRVITTCCCVASLASCNISMAALCAASSGRLPGAPSCTLCVDEDGQKQYKEGLT